MSIKIQSTQIEFQKTSNFCCCCFERPLTTIHTGGSMVRLLLGHRLLERHEGSNLTRPLFVASVLNEPPQEVTSEELVISSHITDF